MKINKTLKRLAIIFFFMDAMLVSVVYLFEKPEVITIQKDTVPTKENTIFKKDLESKLNILKQAKEINSDVVFLLSSPSNLIDDQIVVHANTQNSDYYLNHRFDSLDISQNDGTIYVDSACVKDQNGYFNNQNTVIYGHYHYPEYDSERRKAFTPLENLLTSQECEKHSTLYLIYHDKIQVFELSYVYILSLNEFNGIQYLEKDAPLFDQTTYTLAQMQEYLDYLENNALYKNDDTLTVNDIFITTVSCVKDEPLSREITIFKLVYEDLI